MDPLEQLAKHLSENLVGLRNRKELSQSQLAKAAGIPRSTLANIESGSGNPSLQNLAKICTALQVSIEEILTRPRNLCELIRANDVETQTRAKGQVKIFKLLPDKVRGLDVDRVEIATGATMPGHPHLVGAKEYFTVLQGEVTVYVGGDKFIVKRGDVLAFPGDQPHSYRNSGTSNANAISIVIPVTLAIE